MPSQESTITYVSSDDEAVAPNVMVAVEAHERREARPKRARGARNTNDEEPPKEKKTCNPAKNWSFTLNNHEQKDIDACLASFAKSCSKWAFQEETGENGTKHLQGALTLYTKGRPLTEFPHMNKAHWEVTKNVAASYNYVTKDATRTGGRWTSWEILEPPEIYGWQEQLVEQMLPEMTSRNVYWFMESKGGVGKSTLVRYLCMTREAMMVGGKAADMKYGVQAWKESKGSGPEIVIIDVPRSYQDYLCYAGIEEVANGCFFSSKYEGGMCIVRHPIIIVFANQMPDTSKMSMDRWQLYEIEAEKQRCRKVN